MASIARIPFLFVILGACAAGWGQQADVPDEQPPRRGAIERVEEDRAAVEDVRPANPERESERRKNDTAPEDPDPSGPEQRDAQDEQVERGRYIVHSVAMCVICHTPKDDKGLPNSSRPFEGGVIPVKPMNPNMAPWAGFAPALGPMVRGAEEDVFELLTTGIRPRTGRPPQPPMPPFRLSEEDARAVIAYLKTAAP